MSDGKGNEYPVEPFRSQQTGFSEKILCGVLRTDAVPVEIPGTGTGFFTPSGELVRIWGDASQKYWMLVPAEWLY